MTIVSTCNGLVIGTNGDLISAAMTLDIERLSHDTYDSSGVYNEDCNLVMKVSATVTANGYGGATMSAGDTTFNDELTAYGLTTGVLMSQSVSLSKDGMPNLQTSYIFRTGFGECSLPTMALTDFVNNACAWGLATYLNATYTETLEAYTGFRASGSGESMHDPIMLVSIFIPKFITKVMTVTAENRSDIGLLSLQAEKTITLNTLAPSVQVAALTGNITNATINASRDAFWNYALTIEKKDRVA